MGDSRTARDGTYRLCASGIVVNIDLSRLESRIFDALGVPAVSPWYVAYSGGVDSTVLLHILDRVTQDAGVCLIALHADHGLSAHSAEWRRHCERQCRQWGIECHTSVLTLTPGGKLGLEGEAREARYRWFAEIAGRGGWLFTAHHGGDQAETIIERLARSSGARGLRGILPRTKIYGMNVARPLLTMTRRDIVSYATDVGVAWITDESNEELALTRNYIRNRVLPVLKFRWPDVETALARTASVMRDTQSILDQIAATDLQCLCEQVIRGDPSLHIPALQTLSPERRRNALRHWILRDTGVALGFERLGRVARAIESFPDKRGGMTWPPVDLRIYRDRLYLARTSEVPAPVQSWDLENALVIGQRIVVRPHRLIGRGLKARAVREGVTVAFRRGGEKCRLRGRLHRRTLKKILQETGVPPWQRSRIPLIVLDGEVAAIAGIACCEPYLAGPGETGIEIEVAYT
ncbi:MAG: tRNA(Ile)-lysidine synthase [Gammaproteobacteria bacterium]|nr:tRNA(Ile)-lysidine synthase [Gammaproteobacteria bacterium]